MALGPFSSLLSLKLKTMKKNIEKQTELKPISVDGMLTIVKDEQGLNLMDFDGYDDFDAREISGLYKVKGSFDSKLIMEEKPKRNRGNKPLFKDDNSSLSLGKDGIYYFRFQLPERMIDELPARLVRQSSAIAQKVIRELLTNNDKTV